MIQVIKFWKPDCGPCKITQIAIDKLKQEYQDVAFQDVNVVEDTATTETYSVKSVPTVIIFKDRREQAWFVGAKFRYHEYSNVIDKLKKEE